MSTCSSSCACGAVGREWWLSFAVTKSPELRTREIENTYSFNSIHSTGLLEASSPFARTTAARGTVPSRALSLPPTNQQVRKHGLVDSRDVDSTYVHSARVFLLALTTLMFRRWHQTRVSLHPALNYNVSATLAASTFRGQSQRLDKFGPKLPSRLGHNQPPQPHATAGAENPGCTLMHMHAKSPGTISKYSIAPTLLACIISCRVQLHYPHTFCLRQCALFPVQSQKYESTRIIPFCPGM